MLLLILGLGMVAIGMVQAGAIAVDNTLWYALALGLAPDAIADGTANFNIDNPGDHPWTYTAATATSVKITDSFAAGDMSGLYDHNVLTGTTSAVPTTAIGTDIPTPDADFVDPIYLVSLSIQTF